MWVEDFRHFNRTDKEYQDLIDDLYAWFKEWAIEKHAIMCCLYKSKTSYPKDAYHITYSTDFWKVVDETRERVEDVWYKNKDYIPLAIFDFTKMPITEKTVEKFLDNARKTELINSIREKKLEIRNSGTAFEV